MPQPDERGTEMADDACGRTGSPLAASGRPDISAHGQPDPAYAHLAVMEAKDAWYGDPRDMLDQDLAFFGLAR